MSRVVRLVDRYGDELDFDFHARLGINLDELWFRDRAEPWEKLLSLAGQLPTSSRYMAALYDDDEAVGEYIAVHGQPEAKPARLTLEDWTPERAALITLTEQVMNLNRTMVAVNSKTPPAPVQPLPRPRTAWDRAERRHNICEARDLMAKFNPTPED